MQSRQYATRPTEASSVTKTIYDEVEEMRKKISTLQIENDKLLKEVSFQFGRNSRFESRSQRLAPRIYNQR